MAQFKSLMAEDERKANLEVPNGGLEAIGITKS